MKSNLREKILNGIKPNSKEHKIRLDLVNDFLLKLKESSKDIDVEFCVAGSFGKNTYLKNSSDVDVFARFSTSYKDEDLSFMLSNILEDANINFKKQKGSRDYFSSDVDGVKFEIVPNRRIKDVSEMINSTDVSPLHVEFLKQKFKENKDLCDEIRLAKQFFKAKKLYGAESYINGISGHVIDILIAFYGSLEKLILEVKKWDKETFVDINAFYGGLEDAKKVLDDKVSPLIVIDPIVKNRNAAKALSKENYFKLLILAENFTDFREEDFIVKKFDLSKIIKESKKFGKVNNFHTLFYVFDFDIKENSEDIIGSKLLKLFGKIKNNFLNNDFRVFLSKFEIDIKSRKCLFVYFIENDKVSKLKKITGPFVYMKNAIRSFIDSHSFYFVEEDRLYSYQKRGIYLLSDISKLDIKMCENIVNKDMSFIKKIRVFKK